MAEDTALKTALQGLSTEELMSVIPEPILMQIADLSRRNHQAGLSAGGKGSAMTEGPATSPERNGVQAKRAVNGFMAFRSFYSRIFDDQQKDRSSRLTVLWQKDRYKNKWALIAKVYSFVRDQVGKDNAPLSTFLEYACPAMKVVAAESYLHAFNWTLQATADGGVALVQGPQPVAMVDSDCTMTDTELLATCVANGYPVLRGPDLVSKLSGTSESVMTGPIAKVNSTAGVSQARVNPTLTGTTRFIHQMKQDHYTAALQVFGLPPGAPMPFDVGIYFVRNNAPNAIVPNPPMAQGGLVGGQALFNEYMASLGGQLHGVAADDMGGYEDDAYGDGVVDGNLEHFPDRQSSLLDQVNPDAYDMTQEYRSMALGQDEMGKE